MVHPSLRDVQRYLKFHIQPAKRVPPPPPQDVALNAQRGSPGEERLSVYAGGYVTRVRDALIEVYESIHQVLGERTFTEMAEAYTKEHPSRDYNLSSVGRHLSHFLEGSSWNSNLPFLADLAHLEWAIAWAFHSTEEPSLDAASLNMFSLEEWDRARLTFQRSVTLISSSWPILDIWETRKQPRETIRVELDNRPQQILVFRVGLTVHCERVDSTQAMVLEVLLEGQTLGQACARLVDAAIETPLPLTEWFTRWTKLGLITHCEIVPS